MTTKALSPVHSCILSLLILIISSLLNLSPCISHTHVKQHAQAQSHHLPSHRHPPDIPSVREWNKALPDLQARNLGTILDNPRPEIYLISLFNQLPKAFWF